MSGSWVGGDIAGLQAMASVMKPAPEDVRDVVHALSAKVDGLMGDAGWSGDAATKFRRAWAENAVQAGGLATIMGAVGQTIGELGDRLHQIESDLYNAAHEAEARGAHIGPMGKPLPLVISGDPTAPAAASARAAQADYAAAYESAMQLAQRSRLDAGDILSKIGKELEPGRTLRLDERVTIADYIRGLWTIPNEQNIKLAAETLPAAIANAEATLKQARSDLKAERAAYAAKGLKLPIDDPARVGHLAAVNDLRELETKLAYAESGAGDLPLSTVLDTKLGDVEKLIPELKSAVPGMDFLKEIPVVDLLASGAVAEFQAQDDTEKGWSSAEAHVKDYAAAGIGLAGGAVATAGAVAGLGLVGVSAPAWATLAGGGLAVVGIGDFAYQGFHEHWSEDIHDQGVVSGLGHGVADMGSNTWGDVKSMGAGLWRSADDGGHWLWHKAFG